MNATAEKPVVSYLEQLKALAEEDSGKPTGRCEECGRVHREHFSIKVMRQTIERDGCLLWTGKFAAWSGRTPLITRLCKAGWTPVRNFIVRLLHMKLPACGSNNSIYASCGRANCVNPDHFTKKVTRYDETPLKPLDARNKEIFALLEEREEVLTKLRGLQARYYNLTFSAIGLRYGVSRARVQQLDLKRLRHRLKEERHVQHQYE